MQSSPHKWPHGLVQTLAVGAALACLAGCKSPPPSKPVLSNGHGAKGAIAVTADNGDGTDSQAAAGNVGQAGSQSKTATKAPTTATGKVWDWNRIDAAIEVRRAAGAKKTASGLSDNSATSTSDLDGTKDRTSTSDLSTDITAHIHDAKDVAVTVSLTVKTAGGGVLDTTTATYKLSEDPADNTKLIVDDGTAKQTFDQATKHTFTAKSARPFTMAHAASGSAKFTVEYKLKVTGSTETQADVTAVGTAAIN